MREAARIRAFYPNYFADAAIVHVALRISGHFNDDSVTSDIMGICSDRTLDRYKSKSFADDEITRTKAGPTSPLYRDAIPAGIIWAAARRIFSAGQIKDFAEWRFLAGLKAGDIAYLWPGSSLDLTRRAKERGCIVVCERVNTLLRTSKPILDAEFESLSLPVEHGLTEAAVAEELECMDLADFIFSPSPAVTKSIIDAGLPGCKILGTSYGLDPHEVFTPSPHREGARKTTALFAGRICVRKGVHLLIKAWEKADVDARLVIVGRIAPEMEAYFSSAIKDRTDIEYRAHVENLEPLYRDADFFVLPSLEEGSPLVSYLALGARLPLVVSPMGSGGIVDHDVDGFVVDPHDPDAFASAIRLMVVDGSLRDRMAAKAAVKASYYTWDLVSARRRAMLLEGTAVLPAAKRMTAAGESHGT